MSQLLPLSIIAAFTLVSNRAWALPVYRLFCLQAEAEYQIYYILYVES